MSHAFDKPGIPEIKIVLKSLKSRLFHQLIQYSDEFLQENRKVLANYPWIKDALNQWSRIYEYPFCYHHLVQNLQTQDEILDAGSGITFFPFFLDPRFSVYCVDREDYGEEFNTINHNQSTAVKFTQGCLQELPFATGSLGGIYCISVLEHTSEHATILTEFHRILKPSGLLLLTFDIALDGNHDGIPPHAVLNLIDTIRTKFDCNYTTQNFKIGQKTETLYSTAYVRQWQPNLLPWPPKNFYHIFRNLIRAKVKPIYFREDIEMTFACLVAKKI